MLFAHTTMLLRNRVRVSCIIVSENGKVHLITIKHILPDDLVSEIKSFYLSQGYIVVIKRSKKGKVWLVCDHVIMLLLKKRDRATSSRRNGCNFKLSGVYQVKYNS
jgi:hypothetical protein